MFRQLKKWQIYSAFVLLVITGPSAASTWPLDNMAPVAMTTGPYIIPLGGPLTLNGSPSTDPNIAQGDFIASYAWDIHDDGTYNFSSALPTLGLSWASLNGFGITSIGTYNFRLRVADSQGATSSILTSVQVVPIPAAAWLFGGALGLLGVIRRACSGLTRRM